MRADVRFGWVAAALVLVAAGGWVWSRPGDGEGSTASLARAADLVDMPVASGAPRAFPLDRAAVERAMRDGVLALRLPDGSAYEVAITGTRPEPAGGTTVIGRVHTRLGPQSMVLTLGRDSIFGVIPLPFGRQVHVTTEHGRVVAALAGGLVMRDSDAPPAGDPDYLVPEAAVPTSGARAGRAGSLQPTRTTAAAVADAPASTEITVLAVYTDDLVELRGSTSAVQTEFANLLAIANQAHADSGTGITLRMVGMDRASVDASRTNESVLQDITSNTLAGIDIATRRDQVAADLVALIRPYHDANGNCGIAWLNGAELGAVPTVPAYGFSVSNVAPCGPYVLAHELGHNMGSAHDKAAQSSASGKVAFGAFPFSFGYRPTGPDGFGTVMAYAYELPWLGYFSNPQVARCNGQACGVDDADNAMSLRLKASEIAAFRGPAGTLAVLDALVFEPDPDMPPIEAVVTVRLSGRAATDIAFDATLVPASAEASDFGSLGQTRYTIPAGGREATIHIPIVADTQLEPNETFEVRVSNVTGAPVDDAVGVVTIRNDDPRPVISGRVRFPNDASAPAPGAPFWIHASQLNGDRTDVRIQVMPPDFAYRFAVAPGATVHLTADVPPPFVYPPQDIYDVRTSRRHDLRPVRGMHVFGRVTVPPGYAMPTDTLWVDVSARVDGVAQPLPYTVVGPPEYTYSLWVQPTAWLYLRVTPASDFVEFRAIDTQLRADWPLDIALSTLPSMNVWASAQVGEGAAETRGYLGAVVDLSASAGAEGVQVRYRTVDGTATAGSDYTATSGVLEFAPGERSKIIDLEWFGDDRPEGDETFILELSDVHGARISRPRQMVTIHEPPRIKSRPLPAVAVP